MTCIEWTEPAFADLENIQDYIARDSADYADALVDRLICPLISFNRFQKVVGMCLNRQIPRFESFWSKAIV